MSTVLALTAEELRGDLPMVCARTGNVAQAMTPVWFTRSPWWAWAPLGVLMVTATATTSWAPLASWWAFGAVLLPILVSRGVTGQLPLDAATRDRLAALRRRRFTVVMSALLLTWVAVGLYLIGSRVAGIIVLAVVIGLYALTVGMAVAGRMLLVRGRPADDGGVVLTGAHPDFVAAVELRRTGHRPEL